MDTISSLLFSRRLSVWSCLGFLPITFPIYLFVSYSVFQVSWKLSSMSRGAWPSALIYEPTKLFAHKPDLGSRGFSLIGWSFKKPAHREESQMVVSGSHSHLLPGSGWGVCMKPATGILERGVGAIPDFHSDLLFLVCSSSCPTHPLSNSSSTTTASSPILLVLVDLTLFILLGAGEVKKDRRLKEIEGGSAFSAAPRSSPGHRFRLGLHFLIYKMEE